MTAVYVFTDNTTGSGTEVNYNFGEAMNVAGKELIRATIGASQTKSVAGAFDDWFVEAYTSAGGRNSYVDVGGTTTATFNTSWYQFASTGLITHSIPTGTFNTAISSAFVSIILKNWEAGGDVQFKLTNTGGDDSGYFSVGVNPAIVNFSAFTHGEPQKLVIKLVQKGGGTAGYPAIYGVALRCA